MTTDTIKSDKAFLRFRNERRYFWDTQSEVEDKAPASFYRSRLQELYRSLIPTGSSVLELGCGTGDLLAALEPKRGVGIDFSETQIALARARHPDMEFLVGDVHEIGLEDTFEYIVISDLINDVWDVQTVLEVVGRLCRPETRIVMNSFNRLWQGPLALARAAGLARMTLRQNWLSVKDVSNLLRLTGYDVVSTSEEILLPIPIPIISSVFNRVLAKLWPLNHLALTQFFVARPDSYRHGSTVDRKASVSVIVPARNEAGHIEEILDRVPTMGSRTEVIFVEGRSTDDTWQAIHTAVAKRDDKDIRCYQQPGSGKGDAVRHGFKQATGDILMILDADMTVAPEDLPRFFDALTSGSGEFINGVRLVYPMEVEAMRFLNYLGNKFFGLVFSWLLKQPVKDTLCGTKVLTRESYDVIAMNRSFFGDFDPFGDFDLLFGAAKASFKIIDVPIRYRERRYGTTNIDRWRHGVLLLRMAWFAARKLRFI